MKMKNTKFKKVTKRMIAAVLSFMMVLAVLGDVQTVKAEGAENTVTESESTTTDTNNTFSYEGDGYAVTYIITNSWNDGYTAEVSIKNTGSKKIYNWKLMFSLDGEITNIWNAKINSRNEDGLYTIEGESYNSNISPDSAVSFGFNASGSQQIPEFHFSQSVQMPVEEGDFEVGYAVSDDWETGFVGEISILNKSSQNFKDWCISFDWENEIDNIWNAKIVSHEENHYMISCEDYNRIIEARQQVQFGFSCQSGKSSKQPENITVTHYTDGNAEDEENGDDSEVEDEIDPSEVTEYAEIEYQDGNCAKSVIDDVRFVNYAPELLEMEWMSSDESVVSNEGHVTRGQEDQTVTVTSNIKYKGQDYQKEFVLTVKRITNIDVSTLQDYSLSQLEQMNNGDEYYEVEINDYRYLESIYGTYSDVKVDSYETALASFHNVRSAMGIKNPDEELQITEAYADEFGYIFKFNQMYKGVQVLNCGVTVSSDEDGNTDYLDSSYFPLSNEISVISQVSREEAVQSAVLCGYTPTGENDGVQQISLVVFNEYGKGTLVWELNCQRQDDPWGTYEVFVDAQSGEALFAYEVSCNYVTTGKDLNEKSRIFYIKVQEKNGKNQYSLEDRERKIKVYSEENTNQPITKTRNKWMPTEVSAMANMKDVYDYFENTFNRKSYDNKGGEINVYLAPSIGDQSGWDGYDEQRGRYGNIWIGEGVDKKGIRKSWAAEKDVLAHEFTHGVNSSHSLLGNKGTIGIVNEAYADIFACYADGNWRMGESVEEVRNIAEPLKSHCAQKVGGIYYEEGGDPHVNSTVISHIAYQMENLSLSVESKKIWYHSLVKHKKGWTDLWKVRNNVINAAKKVGCSQKESNKISQLFKDAGITKLSCKKSSAYFKELDAFARINLKKSSVNDSIQITGRVVEADKDFDFGNDKILDSVLVQDASNKEITKTDERGNYLAEIKEENPIVIHFSKNGYLEEIMYLASENIIGQDIRYCDMVEMIPAADGGKGKADGYIRDSVTGTGIKNLKISIRKGINNIYTDSEKVIETKQDGYYQTPELEAGNYCLEISSLDEKYMSTYFNIKIFGNMTMKNQNMSISDSLEDNQMRVVLTWGSKPRDLDSHLIYRLSNGNEGHISYMNKENVMNGACIAKLDVDDTNSYGPETTTIYNGETGDYTFYVKNYSKEAGLGDGNAMVKVYLGNSSVPSYTFIVPDGQEDIWTVFKYNSAVGRLTVVNELGSDVKQ